MSIENLKEQVAYVLYSRKLEKENEARVGSSVERFNSLIESFREETKDIDKCWWHDIEDLCNSLLQGEFEFNGQLGKGHEAFYNGEWKDKSEATIVTVGGIEVQFYLFPPNKESSKYHVIYHVEHS
jgi:hypothetical protein